MISELEAGQRQGLPNAPRSILRLGQVPSLSRLLRQSIRTKIVVGYAIALAIACVGAVTARVVEEFANEAVEEKAELVQAQANALSELHVTLLEIHELQYRLVALSDRPDLFLEKSTGLLKDAIKLENLLAESASILLQEEEERFEDEDLDRATQQFQQWLTSFRTDIEIYIQETTDLMRPIGASGFDSREVRQLLATHASSETSNRVGESADKLGSIKTLFVEASYDITHEAYEGVEVLESQVMAVGLLVAVVLGIIHALLTSRAIAHPLEITTAVAQRVTKESNYQLQVPIASEDEAGQLALSLNQLIRQVAETIQELQQAQAQLVHNEKMSSLGRLVAGIAHEMNNPVSFIYGNVEHTHDYVRDLLELVQLYQQQYPNPTPAIQARAEDIELEFLAEDLPQCLSSMKIGAERIREIVLSLRIFARLDEAGAKEVDLHEGIDSTLLILSSQLARKIEVVKQYGELPLVECYPVQMNQVFMNLLANAIDALLECPDRDRKQVTIQTQVVGGDRVQISIRDNGPGIPAEIQTKIFDLFFTTKPVGKGTGLGLSTCYEIVQRHGGQIHLNSKLGQGTEFIVTLPVRQKILLRA